MVLFITGLQYQDLGCGGRRIESLRSVFFLTAGMSHIYKIKTLKDKVRPGWWQRPAITARGAETGGSRTFDRFDLQGFVCLLFILFWFFCSCFVLILPTFLDLIH